MNLRNTSKTIASFTIKLVTCLIIAALLFALSTKSFEFGRKVFTDKGYEEAPGKNISVTISESMSRMDISKLLKEKGIIDDSYVFFLQTYLYEGKFKSGKYKLNTSSSPEEIVEILSAKKTDTNNKK